MTLRRRGRVLRVLALAAAAGLALSGCSTQSGDSGESGDTVKIALLNDMSGPLNLFGQPTQNVADLAVEQINEAGGVNGKQVVIEHIDGQSTARGALTATERLIGQGDAVALFGMHDSASRDAVAPVTQRAGLPYFYTPLFEGGTCSANMITSGEVPSQQLATSVPWVQEHTGKKKWFVVAADYAWGQNVRTLAEQYISESGGEVVGSVLTPVGTTDFQSVLTQLRQSGAELVIPALIGGDAISFEKQAYDAGLGNDKIQRLALMYENATRGAMGPEINAGMYNIMAYDNSIDSDDNQEFLGVYYEKFGDDAPPVTTLSLQTWIAINAWAKAAEQSGDLSADKLLPAVPGTVVEGPAGPVRFEKNHFASHTMYLTEFGTDGNASVIQRFDDVQPDEDCAIPLG